MAGIVELADNARLYRALGIQFERVTASMERLPAVLAEGSTPWIGAVDCHEEMESDRGY